MKSWSNACPACKGYPDEEHTMDENCLVPKEALDRLERLVRSDGYAAEEALDSLDTVLVQYERAMGELGWTMVNVRARDAVTTVRGRLERLTEERDALAEQGRIAAARYGENFTRRVAAESEVARLTAELQRNKEEHQEMLQRLRALRGGRIIHGDDTE